MRKRSILIPFFIWISILKCFSQAGTPDPSFGTNGKITANFGFPDFRVNTGYIQQDGKIIIAGSALNATRDFLLVRFLPDGKLDNSFGNGGIVYTDIDNDDEVTKVVSLPDGSILAAGISNSWTSIAKYHEDGTPDLSFSNAGSRRVGPRIEVSRTDIKVQPDGKILLSGNGYSGQFKIYRLKPNGVEEPASEFLGTTKDPVADSYGYENNGVYLLPDGSILAGGIRNTITSREEYVVKLDSKGRIDSTFGEKGWVIQKTAGEYVAGSSLDIDSLGRIVLSAVQSIRENDTDTIHITRFNPDGHRDATFGNNGSKSFLRITDDVWHDDLNLTGLMQADNKIVLAATTPGKKGFIQMSAQRFNEDGTADNTFGTGGVAVSADFPFVNEAVVVLSQADKKIVVAGYGFVNGRFSVAMVRFLPDGTPDLSMGTSGMASVAVGTSTLYGDAAQCVIPLDNGKVLAAGFAENGQGNSAVLVRFNADGTPDTQFGDNGQTYVSLYTRDFQWSFQFEWLRVIMAMSTDKKGNIYLLTRSANRFTGEHAAVIFRFTPDGKPDPEFAYYGRKEINIHPNKGELPLGLVVQSDDKPVLAVETLNGNGYFADVDAIKYEALMRLNTDGTIDSTYGTNGVYREMLLKDIDYTNEGNQPARLAIQPDDKIIMTGAYAPSYFKNYALGRYTKDGARDTTFNSMGLIVEDLAGNGGLIMSAAVQPDGKILTGGLAGFSTLCVIRYTADGLIDATFGNNGKLISASNAETANNIAIQPDGKILALGRKVMRTIISDKSYPHIVRTTPEGIPDKTWGNNSGLLVIQSPPYDFEASGAVAVDRNGRVFMAGATVSKYVDDEAYDYSDFALYALRNEMVNCSGYTANAGRDTVMCRELGVTIGLPGNDANTYSWSPSDGLSNPNIAQPFANPFSDRNYVLTVVYPNGCAARDTILVKVLDKLNARAGYDTNFCLGDSVNLGSSNPADYTYSWTSSPVGFVSSAARPRVSPAVTTRYYLTVTSGVCTFSDSINITVSYFAVPVIERHDKTLNIINPELLTYNWQKKQTDGTWKYLGYADEIYTPATDGIYRVLGTGGNCTVVSEPFTFSLTAPPSGPSDPPSDPSNSPNHLYPNPATNVVTLENISLSENWETLDIIPLAGGQAVLTYDITGRTKITVDVSRLSKGYYLAVLKRRGGVPETIRFMKM